MKFIGELKHFGDKISDIFLKSLPDSITLLEFGKELPSTCLPDKVIVVSKNQDFCKVIPFIFENKIKHLVQSSRCDFVKEIALAVQMILEPQNFMSESLSKISGLKTAVPQLKYDFTSMSEKAEVLGKFTKYLSQVPNADIAKDAILNIADELFTNALYNAPTDKTGKHIFQKIERTDKVSLRNVQPPQLFFRHDEKQAAIGCSDPYGSFDLEKLLGRLANLCSTELSQVNLGPGGAGVAYRMMLENSSGLYIAVENNRSTMVCFTLLLGEGLKKTSSYAKNLHFSSY